MLTITDLIERLGGPTVVAQQCEISPAAVCNWCTRGSVAAEHRIRVWRLASAAGLDWRPPGGEGLALVQADAAP